MTASGACTEFSSSSIFSEYFKVSRETVNRLALFEDILRNWQKTINLVAPRTVDQIWHRHFADSAQLLDLAPDGAESWVDLGSGAGFPGLVLAILRAGRGLKTDQKPVMLVESDQRKAAFLREVARQTGVTVDIIEARIEFTSTHDRIGSADVVTARALAPLDKLLGLSVGLLANGGVGLFPKGRDAALEVAGAKRNWRFDCRLELSLTDPDARIVVIENVGARSRG